MWTFSNFAPCDIEYDGVVYPTLEHAYQAAKSLDLSQRASIRDMPTPGLAKKLGQTIHLRRDWDAVKVPIMRMLLAQKFSHEPWRSSLLATGDLELVEWVTWHDLFWGRCTCTRHQNMGSNMLGKLLMQIRTELRNAC